MVGCPLRDEKECTKQEPGNLSVNHLHLYGFRIRQGRHECRHSGPASGQSDRGIHSPMGSQFVGGWAESLVQMKACKNPKE